MATEKRRLIDRWEDLVRKCFGPPQVGPYPPVGAYDKLPAELLDRNAPKGVPFRP
jgi:hypothetical protein